MAVPFGFSAGDFMGAIHLAHKITSALRETGGASSEYNQTISQLDSLEGLLRSVQSIYSADIDPQQLDKLQFLGRECYIVLSKFSSKLNILEPSLGNLATRNNHIVNKTKRVARKLQWSLQLQKELSELAAAMGPRLSAISVQLQFILLERQQKAGASLDILLQGLNDLNSQMDNFQKSLNVQMNSIATVASMEKLTQTLQFIRLEATNYHNSQLDTIRERIDIQAGWVDPKASKQLLDSIQLLTSRFEDHLARSTTNATQSITRLVSELIPCPVDHSESSCHDRGRMKRMEDQLQLLNEKVLNLQSSGALPGENCAVTIRDVQDTIKYLIQALLGFFRASAYALFLKLCVVLPVAQHIFRSLQAPRLLASLTIGESIVFEDVLGRIVHLPYIHFRHYRVFIARLQCEFKGFPGETKVLMNQFRIFRQARCNKFLTKHNWEVAVRPGSRIAMSVLLNSHESEGDACPRCKTTRSGTGMKELFQCTACGLSWALQKPDSRNTSSGKAGLPEVMWDLRLVRHIPEVEDDEPFIPLKSLRDPSGISLHSIDDKDIESFRMVHIQTQSFSADEKAACEVKATSVENCGLCGLAHFSHCHTCPHIRSEIQLREMLESLKRSPGERHLVDAAIKYLRDVKACARSKNKGEKSRP